MFHKAKYRNLVAATVSVFVLTACGSEAEFHGLGGIVKKSEDKKDPLPPNSTDGTKAGPPAFVAPAGTLYWTLACESGQRAAERTANNDVQIWGMGEHKVVRTDQTFPVQINGQVCNPQSGVRDILFIADVSSSMGGLSGADRERSGTCGRKQAVEKVVSTLATDGRARVGVMTFGRDVKKDSKGFLSIADAKQNFVNSDVLCASIDTTNYRAPLEQAIEYFKNARANAVREIYFISDGEPDSEASNGSAAAKTLRDQYGVTIVTMMIKGKDEVLIQHIASKDQNGQPMHTKVEDSADLVAAISKMSDRRIIGAKMRLRAKGAPAWEDRGIDKAGEAPQFSWEIPNFSMEAFPHGVEFELDTWDQQAKHYVTAGSVIWE